MRVFTVSERSDCPISESEFQLLARAKPFQSLMDAGIVSLGIKENVPRVFAGPYVGSAQLGPQAKLEIIEKTPGSALALYRLAFPAAFRFVDIPAQYSSLRGGFTNTHLRDALRRVFVETAQEYVRRGIEAEYRPVVQCSSRPKGRILLKESIRNGLARGHPTRVVYRTNELSRDTVLNKVVLAALERVAGNIGGRISDTQKAARLLLYHFSGIEANRSEVMHVVSRSRAYKFSAGHSKRLFDLACGVIAGDEMAAGLDNFGLPIATFISLEKLFERAVFETAKEIAETKYGWEVWRAEDSDQKRFLFQDTRLIDAQPDVVVSSNDGPILLIDAKYRELGKQLSHDSVYQVLAHAEAFSVKNAWLVGITDGESTVTKELGTSRPGCKVTVLSSRVSALSAVLQDQLRLFAEQTGLRFVPKSPPSAERAFEAQPRQVLAA